MGIISSDFIEQYGKDSHAIMKLSLQYRGEIINACVHFENYIERIISLYFANGNSKRAQELRYCLISNALFNFNTKKAMLGFVVNKYPEFYKENKKLDSEIKKIIAVRNIFAHYKLDTSAATVRNWDGNTITLVSFTTKDSRERLSIKPFSRKKMDEELKRIEDVSERIGQLYVIMLNEYRARRKK